MAANLFDLEKAIATWRQFHLHRRVFLGEDLDELERHLRDHTSHLISRGMDDEAAFRNALQALGDPESGADEYGKVYLGKLRRRRELLHELSSNATMLISYLRVALRQMRKQKLYSFINLFGLIVGITCCLLIGLYVRHEWSYDRFHTKTDRIYRLVYDDRAGLNLPPAAPHEYMAWGSAAHAPLLKEDFPEIEHTVRLSGHHQMLLSASDRKFQEERYFFADSAFFEVFSFPLVVGDPATVIARPNTGVLSETAARRYFGDEDPIGQILRLDSGEMTGEIEVTGVMADIPPNSHLDFEIIVSMSTFEHYARANGAAYRFDSSGYVDFFTYILLKNGESAETLNAKLPDFVQRHYRAVLQDPPKTYALALEPLTKVYLSPVGRRQPLQAGPNGNPTNLYLFSFIGVFIVVIAGLNFVNLATARSVSRAKEVGVRKTVGANRGGLVGQFLAEAVLLTVIATAIATLLARLALPIFRILAGKDISAQPLTDPIILALLVIGALLIGLLAGGYPALVLSRFRPSQVLKGPFGTSRRGAGLRKALVVFQFTTAIALVVATVVVRTQLGYLRERPLGFNDRQQLVLDYGHDNLVRAEMETIKQELAAVPGVESVAATRSIPGGYFPNAGTWIEVPDGTMQDLTIGLYEVDREFLTQLGVGVAAGRLFSRDFETDANEVLIVNVAAARDLGYADPADIVGKRFEQWGRRGVIVGVVENFNHESLHHEIRPLSFRVSPWLRFLVLRIAAEDANQVVKDVQARWSTLAPHRPFLYSFLDRSFDALYRSEDRFGALFGTFAALAIIIACLGLFGLAAYAVQQRTKEIGIRKVLGATAASVAGLMSKEFLKLVLIGFAVAVPVAYILMSRWLEGFAYRIEVGPGIFLLAGGLALVIALLTVSYQSIKAAVADPVKSLRYE